MLRIEHLNPQVRQVPTETLKAVQALFDASPYYYEQVMGSPAGPDEAYKNFYHLPEIFALEQKYCFGYYQEGLLGFSEILKAYPEEDCGYIGLHLIGDAYQGQGLGRQSYLLLETYLRSHLKLKQLRLAVALSNPVTGFWERMGFERLAGIKATLEGEIKSPVFEMQKAL